ncbi:MAG: DUF2764 domain-containing protein [Spirochaetales bacterium]|nr:DUF2764 domain-containing protein [Spirochaetales bacterium]
MAEYFYTVSALPHLGPDSPPVLSRGDFLGLCNVTLSGEDWAVLLEARLQNPDARETGNATLDFWFAWDRSLRAELAKLRAGKKGFETESYNQYGLAAQSAADAARSAFGEASPAEAEKLLFQARWAMLDELESRHIFDFDKIIVYYLRLQLAELKQQRNKAEGEKNFSLLYDSIVQKNPSNPGGEASQAAAVRRA